MKASKTLDRNDLKNRVLDLVRDGWTMKDIGAELEISISTVSSLFHEAMREQRAVTVEEVFSREWARLEDQHKHGVYQQRQIEVLIRSRIDEAEAGDSAAQKDVRENVKVWTSLSDVIRKHSESRRKLTGADAPEKADIDPSQLSDADLAKRLKRLTKMAEEMAGNDNPESPELDPTLQ